MHRFSSQSAIRRLRFAGFLYLLVVMVLPVSGVLMVRGVIVHSTLNVAIGFGLGVAGLLCLLVQTLLAQRVRCPLCTMTPLGSKSCQKNRKAKPLFGSYRLRVACAVLVKDHFRCPYCGEPTILVARERPPMNGLTGRS